VSYFSIVVPVCFLFRRKHVLKFRQYQLLGILFLVSAAADVAGYILIRNQISNHAVNNLYFLVSFILLSLMYMHLLSGIKHAIYSLIAASLCLFVWDTFCIQSIAGVQSYLLTFCGVLSIGYSFIYYDHLLDTIPATDIMRFPFFWINTAVAYYFGLNLFLFIFSTYIFENLKDEEILAVWSFHNLNNIVKNILFAVGLSRVKDEM
jgi:hypothetical protein